MTALQFVSEERDTAAVWLARAAPRRWYTLNGQSMQSGKSGFGVDNAPTRYGNVSFTVNGADAFLAADFSQPIGSKLPDNSVLINLRLRDPSGDGRPLHCVNASAGSDCVVKQVEQSTDVVQLLPLRVHTHRIELCKLSAIFL